MNSDQTTSAYWLHKLVREREAVFGLYKSIYISALRALCQHLAATLRDEQGVFELCRALAVSCDTGPLVGPQHVLPRAQVDHGFDGEHVSRLHHSNRLVLGIVRNIRGAVKQLADAVTAICTHHGEAVMCGQACDDIADLAIHGAGLDDLDGFLQTLVRRLDQQLRVDIHLADQPRLVQIRVMTAIINGDVNIDNVTLAQHGAVGNAVTDNFVQWGAARLGEAFVAQWRGIGAEQHALCVNQRVNIIGAHTCLHLPAHIVQHLCTDLSTPVSGRCRAMWCADLLWRPHAGTRSLRHSSLQSSARRGTWVHSLILLADVLRSQGEQYYQELLAIIVSDYY